MFHPRMVIKLRTMYLSAYWETFKQKFVCLRTVCCKLPAVAVHTSRLKPCLLQSTFAKATVDKVALDAFVVELKVFRLQLLRFQRSTRLLEVARMLWVLLVLVELPRRVCSSNCKCIEQLCCAKVYT